MPDGFNDSEGQVAQRGFRGGFPGRRFPRGRFPGRFPIRRRFPGPIIIPPIFFPIDRCFYIDRFGRCCDRFGRCYYRGWPYGGGPSEGWYGMAGGWDMMPDIEDAGYEDTESAAVFNDYTDYGE